jgi:hypothetical protein
MTRRTFLKILVATAVAVAIPTAVEAADEEVPPP